MQQSTRVNSSLMKNGFSAKIGAMARMPSRSSLVERLTTLSLREFWIDSMSVHQSCSMRCMNRRLSARATGYTGSSGGCGKRSSRYSIITRVS
jgi:hypothetical protein